MAPSRLQARLTGAAAGILAAGTGAAAAHLVAALTDPATSPVLAVGSQVIDLTPTPVKEWAVRELGTADKPVLIGSVLVGTLLLAALAGMAARRWFVAGAAGIVLLTGVAGFVAVTRPEAGASAVLPAVVAAAVGVAVLALLTPRPRRDPAERAPGTGPLGRRGFLLAAGAAIALAGAGEWIGRARTRIADVVLPAARRPAAPLPAGLEERYAGISPFRTPTGDFYRVDTRLTLPVVDLDGWRLRIDGDVPRPVELTFDELLAMPLVERDITMTCVSNEVGGEYVGAARWLGVPLPRLLARAGLRSTADTGADQLLSTDVDGFTISTPLEAVLDGREPLVAVGMNGRPLPREHGFPVRLVTPGLYGFVGSTKWLTRLTLTTYAEETAYWTDREWATDAPVKVSSRIDTPRPLSTADAGQVVVGGVAWAQQRGVAGVELRVDGGAWQPCELGPDAGIDYWRQWYFLWDAEPGEHMLAVRATTEDGEVQTSARMTPFPEGSTGVQEIVVRVA
ncbi:molybdopterin-dependent oxidoreductase [Nocardioides campestrisoli]|uniref:molybdopterin-dependent oxidoreductase n=1 Tax=Nocardioides campestrisoli TaxID=2736757 RepID=UPI0015E67C7B|nr:molybdopterin-dependent oxidoreductase [Nocardioides campestrisoli]